MFSREDSPGFRPSPIDGRCGKQSLLQPDGNGTWRHASSYPSLATGILPFSLDRTVDALAGEPPGCAGCQSRDTNMRCRNVLLAEHLESRKYGLHLPSGASSSHKEAGGGALGGGLSIPRQLDVTGGAKPSRPKSNRA